MTLDQLIESARSQKWSRKQIKQACFDAGIDADGRQRAWDACGCVAGPAAMERAPAAVAPAVAVAPAPVETTPAAEPVKLQDGAVLWCDAARNVVRRTVNSYGRIEEFDNGGCRVAVVCRESGLEQRFFNAQTYSPSGEFDQFMAECFAVLKAVEVATEHGLKSVTIRNDRIGGFDASTKRGYKGATYLWVARKMADEAGITVTFDRCEGSENAADRASRTEA